MRLCRVEVYKAKDGFRWRLLSRNGKVIADGGEAYTRKPSARVISLKLHNATMESFKHASKTGARKP